MKLYRINWEYEDISNSVMRYLGAEEFETHHLYEYVLGDRMLGKAVYEGIHIHGMRVESVVPLVFSFKALRICARDTMSCIKNLTKKGE